MQAAALRRTRTRLHHQIHVFRGVCPRRVELDGATAYQDSPHPVPVQTFGDHRTRKCKQARVSLRTPERFIGQDLIQLATEIVERGQLVSQGGSLFGKPPSPALREAAGVALHASLGELELALALGAHPDEHLAGIVRLQREPRLHERRDGAVVVR